MVKSIIKQFDLPKAQIGKLNDALLELAGDLENEELKVQIDINNNEDDDNVEGWIDECELMTVSEREKLEKSVGLLRLMLTKVSTTRSELESSYKNCIATEDGLCYQKFDNNFTAEVVFYTQGIKTKCSHDAP